LRIRERLELIGGRVQIESAPGKGTQIGRTGADPERGRAGRSRWRASPDQGSERHPEQIPVVLVDDHAILREGLASLLQRYTDIEVVGEAEDGQAAIGGAPSSSGRDRDGPFHAAAERDRSHQEDRRRASGVRVVGLSMHEEEYGCRR
jgi:hypothetical protein